jgi:threonine dehydratase
MADVTPSATNRKPGRADVEAAYPRIEGAVRRTPVLDLGGLPGVDARVVLKLELTQHTGSFKARGALNNVLSLDGSATGVCAASGGNHAAAVAWAAQKVGVTADVFVPRTATPAKIARIQEYGGRVHLVDGFVKEALEECADFSTDENVPQIHPYDTFETVSGAGTVGLEVAEQVPAASLVVLPCGGGGLFAGTATALTGRNMRVQPVEPEMCPALAEALAAGGPVEVAVGGVASDALGAARVGEIAYQVAVDTSVLPVLVSESEILEARRLLWSTARVLAEPGACVALAAVATGRVAAEVPAGETVVVVVSGGNNETIP